MTDNWSDEELIKLLDHPLINQRYFFPQYAPLPGSYSVHTGECTLSCWRSAPPSDRPVLVHFHGNGELVHHWMDLAGWIQTRGFDVFLAEYRGYGASGGKPRLAAMLDDVGSIVEAVGVPPERILSFGRSVGSLYAIELVHRYPSTMGLVIESGINDLLQRIVLRVSPQDLGCSLEKLKAAVGLKFDQTAKLAGYSGPSLFLHAEGDTLVRMEHAEANHAAAGSEDKKLVRMPQGDHNSILSSNMESYLIELGSFLEKCSTSR
jgi:alpha-beta hydrolase superfamily lysophospholipase